MIDLLRNMIRRQTRTAITGLKIVIGVFALTVMNAVAEKINRLLGGRHPIAGPSSAAG
jgi:hypothetical protein